MTLMYNKHYTLSTTHYHAPTDTWLVHGTDSLLSAYYTPPRAQSPGPDTYTREDDPYHPHVWGTWGRKSLNKLLSIRNGNQGLGRTMYCLAKWTQQSWRMAAERGARKVTVRPQQWEAVLNHTGPGPPRPVTMQLCLYTVAASLMILLWPGPNIPTQHYPHLTEEDMPAVQRCFFRTLDCLQQAHPHVLELKWTPPPSNSPTHASKTTQRRHQAPHMTPPTAPAPART